MWASTCKIWLKTAKFAWILCWNWQCVTEKIYDKFNCCNETEHTHTTNLSHCSHLSTNTDTINMNFQHQGSHENQILRSGRFYPEPTRVVYFCFSQLQMLVISKSFLTFKTIRHNFNIHKWLSHKVNFQWKSWFFPFSQVLQEQRNRPMIFIFVFLRRAFIGVLALQFLEDKHKNSQNENRDNFHLRKKKLRSVLLKNENFYWGFTRGDQLLPGSEKLF